MGIASEIRKTLDACGDCVNCKLMIWNGKAEPKTSNSVIKFTSENDDKFFYSVRCNWTKSTIAEPQLIFKCEGKKSFKGEEE